MDKDDELRSLADDIKNDGFDHDAPVDKLDSNVIEELRAQIQADSDMLGRTIKLREAAMKEVAEEEAAKSAEASDDSVGTGPDETESAEIVSDELELPKEPEPEDAGEIEEIHDEKEFEEIVASLGVSESDLEKIVSGEADAAEVIMAAGVAQANSEFEAESDKIGEEGGSEPAEGDEKKVEPSDINNAEMDFSAYIDEEGENPPEKKKGKLLSNILIAVCVCVFVYCIGRIAVYYYTGYKWKKSNEKLAEIVGDISQEIPEPNKIYTTDIFFPDEVVYADEVTERYVDEVSDDWAQKYASLVEMNSDCIGWIQIPDTKINYPVMYTPEEPDYYLYKNFEGEYLFRGLPFLNEGSLLNISPNLIIHGHNMNDGTAFAGIVKYLNWDFAMDHQYCYFNTAYNEGVYQLMAVVLTKIYNVDDDVFKYYKYYGDLTEEEFNEYVYGIEKLNRVDTGVTATYGDQLITLSTCYEAYDENGRVIVVFKRIK